MDEEDNGKFRLEMVNNIMVNCGVSQGFILGPLLFPLFINLMCSHFCCFLLYADDTNMFVTRKNIKYLICLVNTKLNNWLNANKLYPNLKRKLLQYLVFLISE